MDLVCIETYSENARLLDKIATFVIEAKIAVLCNLTDTNITLLENHAKRRIRGQKLSIITKQEHRKTVIRLILDNHNEDDPKITVHELQTGTLATEEWVHENIG